MGDNGREVEAGEEHLLHLVPGLPHLAAVNALDGEGLEDDFAPIHGRGGRQYAKLRNLRAVVHVGHHIAESNGRARHFKTHVEAADTELLHGAGNGLALRGVHRERCAHLLGDFEAILAEVGHDDVLRAGKLGDARGHRADEACARDEHVLAEEGEREGGVRGVAEGIHNGSHVVADARVEFHDVALGNAEVFGKRAVTVNAHADAVLANVLQAAAAIAAVAAGDVSLARHAVAHLDVAHACADFLHHAHIFVTDGHGRFDGLLAPFVPLINMEVGAANSRFLDFDEDIVHAHFGHGHILHPDALHRFFLY